MSKRQRYLHVKMKDPTAFINLLLEAAVCPGDILTEGPKYINSVPEDSSCLLLQEEGMTIAVCDKCLKAFFEENSTYILEPRTVDKTP